MLRHTILKAKISTKGFGLEPQIRKLYIVVVSVADAAGLKLLTWQSQVQTHELYNMENTLPERCVYALFAKVIETIGLSVTSQYHQFSA